MPKCTPEHGRLGQCGQLREPHAPAKLPKMGTQTMPRRAHRSGKYRSHSGAICTIECSAKPLQLQHVVGATLPYNPVRLYKARYRKTQPGNVSCHSSGFRGDLVRKG